jgi:hypothetical protein
MAKIIVHVTEEDIRNGTAKSRSKCPIANALQREHGWPYPRVTYTGTHNAQGTYLNPVTFYVLPDEAIKFMDAFDADKGPSPITFTMHSEKD